MVVAINNTEKLWLPTLQKEIDRPWFLPDISALQEIHKLLSNSFFLVKNDGFGERLKCPRCGKKEQYITLNCIERPFTGMTHGLYAYYRAAKDNKLTQHMNPVQLSRYKNVSRMFHSIDGLPDLATMHPEMARKIVKDLGPSDELMGAVSLGVLEAIAPKHAQRLVDRINDTGLRPKLVLEKPTTYDVYRALDYTRSGYGTTLQWSR